MLKEVRKFSHDDFMATLIEHYHLEGCGFEMTFLPDGKGIATYVITDRQTEADRRLDPDSVLREIRNIFFPGEAVNVVSIYKPKEDFLGQTFVYLALDRDIAAPPL